MIYCQSVQILDLFFYNILMDIFGNNYFAGITHPFEACSNIYAVTKDIVTFNDHII